MIDAKDLRVGNLVFRNGECLVSSIVQEFRKEPYFIEVMDRGEMFEQCFESEVEPIPITEEKLLKCGFKYRKSGIGGQDSWAGYGDWHLNDIALWCDRRNADVFYFDRNWDWKVRYVHELQNLIHSLTRQELIINRI